MLNLGDLNSNCNKQWKFITEKGYTYLRSELLHESGFSNSFFTRLHNNYSPEEIASDIYPGHSNHSLIQIHGSKVIKTSKDSSKEKIKADGIISNTQKEILWIKSSDCLPILLADPEKGYIAAVHAGWKGISLGIIGETINSLKKNNVNPQNLIVAIGPSISKENYEVGLNTAKAVHESTINASEAMKKEPEETISGKRIIEFKKDKVLLDLKKAAKIQLESHRIQKKNISISFICTYNESHYFNSWRREKLKSNQWSCIVQGE